MLLAVATVAFEVAAAPPPAATFEQMTERAAPAVELATLVAPFLDTCPDRGGALERARCQGASRFLRARLPEQAYAIVVDDPDSVSVSEYDARIKGVRLGVVGCLACKEPVTLGQTGQKRLVTLKAPERKGTEVADGVEVASVDLTFGGIPESRAWLKQVRRHLRAEFVFQPAGTEWSFGPSRGFAFTLLGARVFNRCTGEVLYSQPPSQGPARKVGELASCSGEDEEGEAARSELPARLVAANINRAMAEIRPLLDACVELYKLRGTSMIEYVVSGHTGMPISVKLQGALGGTAVGQCLIKAARQARFPTFSREQQEFSYPLVLRKN